MNRKDKIKSIKALLTGEKTVNDLIKGRTFITYKGIDKPYQVQGRELTEEEYQEWLSQRHPKDKVVVFMEQEGNEPLDAPIEDTRITPGNMLFSP